MPVAMIATAADWTDRFHRLRAVRNCPPDRTLKNSQIAASATIMPSRRVSSSSEPNAEVSRFCDGSRAETVPGTAGA
jgi:hypothetical protein